MRSKKLKKKEKRITQAEAAEVISQLRLLCRQLRTHTHTDSGLNSKFKFKLENFARQINKQ